jgi:chorismate synthase
LNSFGRIFKIAVFGESHGACVGVVIDGCLPGVPLSESDFVVDLGRRKAGGEGTTARSESDSPTLMSGVFQGRTTGAPITVLFENHNTKSADYEFLKNTPRPGHADFVAAQRFGGFNDFRGGGHFSGRLTLALVAAGVVAKKLLAGIEIQAQLIEAGGIADVEAAVAAAVKCQDSIGGIVDCSVSGVPIGWGAPFFDSVESLISHAVFSIPAIKGIAFGSGFAAAAMVGSEHNDAYVAENGKTETNNAGGINGGLSNGNDLYFRVAVKPTSSTPKVQHTWNQELGTVAPLAVKGRHDLCIALRVPVVVEAVTAMVLADLMLLDKASRPFAVE